MKALRHGRIVQVEKFRQEDVLIGDKVVKRQLYTDDDGNRYIKRKDGGLSLVKYHTERSMTHVHMYYVIVEGE